MSVIPTLFSLVLVLIGIGSLIKSELSIENVVFLLLMQPLLIDSYVLRKPNAVFGLTTEYLELQSQIWDQGNVFPWERSERFVTVRIPSIVDTNQEGCVL